MKNKIKLNNKIKNYTFQDYYDKSSPTLGFHYYRF